MDANVKDLLDKDPHITLNTALSSLKSRFSEILSRTYTNSELKNKLSQMIERTFMYYSRDIQEAFNNYDFKESTYSDFIRDKIQELGIRVRNQLETHGAVMIGSLADITSEELKQILAIEQDSTISSADKVKQQSSITSEKEKQAGKYFETQKADDIQSIDAIRPYLDDEIDDIIAYVGDLSKDERSSELLGLKSYISDHLSPKVISSLSEALKSHSIALYTTYTSSNDYYEKTLQELLQYFQERDRQASDSKGLTSSTIS